MTSPKNVRNLHDQATKSTRGATATSTRLRARRKLQGKHSWHVDIRSSVIICQACGQKIPRSQRPPHCPGCGAGKP
jgi:rubrerythrin